MLAGDLKEFTLPDLFQLLALTKKTGALRITHEGGEGRVYFREGEVYFALSDDRRFPLGARLVASGHLSADRLQQLLRDHKGARAVEVAADLVSSDEIDEAALEGFVREQIHDALFSLLRLDSGSFEFAADEGTHWPGSRLAGTDALDEAHRRVDEWERLSAHMPSGKAVLSHAPNPPGEAPLALDREQWHLVALVDGKRTVDQLIDLSGKGAFAAGRVISDLVEAGLVEAHQRPGEGTLAELLAGRHALRQLEEVALGAGTTASSPPGSSSRDWAATEPAGNGVPAEQPGRARSGAALAESPPDGQSLLRGRRPSWATTVVDDEPHAAEQGGETEPAGPDGDHSDPGDGTDADEPADGPDAVEEPVAVHPTSGNPGSEVEEDDQAPDPDEPAAEGAAEDERHDPVTPDDGQAAQRADDDSAAGAEGDAAVQPDGDEDPEREGRDAEHADGDEDAADEGEAAPRADDEDGSGGPQPSPAPVRRLDRAQVARELSSLGIDDAAERRPSARRTAADGQAKAAEDRASTVAGQEGATRLSRDEEINRGLLLRLIDGVKGA